MASLQILIMVLGFAVASSQSDNKLTSTHGQVRSLTSSSGQRSAGNHVPVDYQDRRAFAKQELIWEKIVASAYPTGQLPVAPAANKQFLFSTEFLRKTFTTVSDEMPAGRKKLTHEYGSVGKVQVEIFPNSPYTGLFAAPGTEFGLVRLSLVILNDPVFFASQLMLKFLIDGQPSVNINSFESGEGRFATDKNFFHQKLTNIVPNPHSPAIVGLDRVFNKTLDEMGSDGPDRPESSLKMGLYEHAAITATGQTVSNVVAPYKIEWVANPILTAFYENELKKNATADFRTLLGKIPENTVLYDIILYRQAGYPGAFVGRLTLRSALIASKYGDETLFFQHPLKRWAP